ncbi:peroxide stress protein YaaA [uncultured Sulfitobacter sp.]|uniref:peroxide stress protein YaaA n=1 Tax=uncultured Sulfitobacter sp. TaxID=191468 RepID=UPI002601C222|nr:peroxide stress protein YaaA [uncultured Sulfitobacter sp.]
MLVVISPAKKLDWALRDVDTTTPDFLDNAAELVEAARGLSVSDLKSLMSLSENLAALNRERFQTYVEAPEADLTRPAALAFAGDTYQGLEADSLDAEELAFAQDHLRILSGLYGVLRPLDAIQPYRLEMGSKLKTQRGKNLYEYWGSELSNALNAQADATNSDVLVNCASQEYFGAVDLKALKLRVITPQFMEDKGDGKGPKIVSFYAKKARGAMARFVMQKRINQPDGILEFDIGGYAYTPELSKPDTPVFLRPYPAS